MINKVVKEVKNDNTNLPRWNLNDLYPSKDSKEFKDDVKLLEQKITDFMEQYQNKVADLSPDNLLKAVQDFEIIEEIGNKISAYAFLLHSVNIDNTEITQFYQNTLEILNDMNAKLLFFGIEINHIDDEKLANAYQESTELSRYKNWFASIRLFKNHQLSLPEENALNTKNIAACVNWIRLFNETIAKMRFQVSGKEYDCHGVTDLMVHPDGKKRREAEKVFIEGLKKENTTLNLITNTLLQNKASEDNLRNYEHPMAQRNLSNQVSDEVVNLLIETVKQNYPKLSHRYYKIKAKLLGKKQLDSCDRNAPYPEYAEKKYSFDEAKDIILESYREFSPKLESLAKDFFDNNWIDAPAEPSKMIGAFCHPTSSKVHPYVMMNFQGKARDVLTLSHELGHGIHFCLAKEQGELLSNAPLTICETASVFSEQLTFRRLLKDCSAEQKRYVIAGKVEDMLATVVRQIAFCNFELKLHNARKQGELSTPQINELFLETQKEALGDSINLCEDYGFLWSYIPHFIHTPFYVYAYAFGDCLVNSLYSVYKNQEIVDFEDKYFAFLSAGNSKKYDELLNIFDFNPQKQSFWQKGLDMIANLIDQI